MKGLSAFLDMRRCKDWDHEISSWKYLSKDLFHQFSWNTETHSPPWIPFRECWRSAAVIAWLECKHALLVGVQLLANALGKCQFVVDRLNPFTSFISQVYLLSCPFIHFKILEDPLVHLGHYNKILLTRWCISHRSLFLTILEAWKSKIEVPANSVSGGAHFLVHSNIFVVSSYCRRGEGAV